MDASRHVIGGSLSNRFKRKVCRLWTGCDGFGEKLGESLARSIWSMLRQEGPTSSIDAFKHIIVSRIYSDGKTLEAIPFAKRAL